MARRPRFRRHSKESKQTPRATVPAPASGPSSMLLSTPIPGAPDITHIPSEKAIGDWRPRSQNHQGRVNHASRLGNQAFLVKLARWSNAQHINNEKNPQSPKKSEDSYATLSLSGCSLVLLFHAATLPPPNAIRNMHHATGSS
jgi:hypothetical protein